MRIDHITIHVPRNTFKQLQNQLPGSPDKLTVFMEMLGFTEIEVGEVPMKGLYVRWFGWGDEELFYYPNIHFVEGDTPPERVMAGTHDQLVLGHFAIAVDEEQFRQIRVMATLNQWLQRDSGSGRYWVGWQNIRVEVRHEEPVAAED